MPGHQDCKLILTTFLWHVLEPQTSNYSSCANSSCWSLLLVPVIRAGDSGVLDDYPCFLRGSSRAIHVLVALPRHLSNIGYLFFLALLPSSAGLSWKANTGPPCLGAFACAILLSTASHRIIRTARLWSSHGLTTLNDHSPKTSSSLCMVLLLLVFLTHHFSYLSVSS